MRMLVLLLALLIPSIGYGQCCEPTYWCYEQPIYCYAQPIDCQQESTTSQSVPQNQPRDIQPIPDIPVKVNEYDDSGTNPLHDIEVLELTVPENSSVYINGEATKTKGVLRRYRTVSPEKPILYEVRVITKQADDTFYLPVGKGLKNAMVCIEYHGTLYARR